MEEQNVKKPLLKEADLLQLVSKVLSKWKFILKTTLCFMVFGVVIAFSTIKYYTSEIMVAPESSSSGMAGGLASLASFAGLDMDAGGDAIYPLLYPDIIQSLPFLCSLFDVDVQSVDGEIDTTYGYYLKNYRKQSWMKQVKDFPKKMILRFVALFKEKKPMGNVYEFDPYRLSEAQLTMVVRLKDAINVFVDKKTDVITLSFTEQDPLIAAMMADTIMVRLQERITEYRTKKALADCVYFEGLYNDAKREYEKAQENYAIYVDRNRNVTQERFLIEKERLEADKELKNMLYSQWAQQLQLAKAKVQEQTPAFTTLKPATVPVKPSSMRRLVIVLIFAFLGGVFSVAYVALKEPFSEICRKIFKSEK